MSENAVSSNSNTLAEIRRGLSIDAAMVLGAGAVLGAFSSRVLAETPWVTWPFYRWELTILNRFAGPQSSISNIWPSLSAWINRVHLGLQHTYDQYPFIAYGTDWLARQVSGAASGRRGDAGRRDHTRSASISASRAGGWCRRLG